MKKIYFMALLWLMAIQAYPQVGLRAPNQREFICYPTDTSMVFVAGCNPTGPNNSRNGGVFTPKGVVRALVIYAGFSNTVIDPQSGNPIKVGDQPLDGWFNEDYTNINTPVGIYPPTSYVDSVTGAMPTALFSNVSEFATYCIPSNTTNKSISRYYYDMSLGQFKLIGDVFKDPATGKPVRVNIDPTGITAAQGWPEICRRVMEKMKVMAPSFDWEPYDQRTNWPNYKCDNSVSARDSFPDYVIMIFRYSNTWAVQPISRLDTFPGSQGAYSKLNGLSNTTYNEYKFDGAGYTLPNGGGNGIAALVHELGHELYSGPHIMGANACAGERFYAPYSGWGMVTGIVNNQSANAWERWLLGWTDIKANSQNADVEDTQNIPNGGTFTLRDFVTTGDAVRVKIPGTNQHLWIENHQKQSLWNHNPWRIYAPSTGGEQIPDMDAGIYMYVEDILPTREDINNSMASAYGKVNGIRVINAQGNFDYTRSTTALSSPDEYSSNLLFEFERGQPNPIAGLNPMISFMDDYPDDTLSVTAGPNGDDIVIGGSGDGKINFLNTFNNSYNEVTPIIREKNSTHNNLLFAAHGGRNAEAINNFGRRSDAFQVGDTINMASNPTIVSYPIYNDYTSELGPTYLNGLSVTIVSQTGTSITIQVRAKQTQINQDVRWCGNIVLPDITSTSGADIDLQSGNTITIDRSGTVNRHTHTVYKDAFTFINPTLFTCTGNAFVKMNSNSNIIVDNGSTFKMESSSKLEIGNGAVLHIKKESILRLIGNAQIIIKEGGKLLIDEGGVVQLDGTSKITMEAPVSTPPLNSVIEIAHTSAISLDGTSKIIAGNQAKIIVKDTSSLNIGSTAELQYENGAALELQSNLSLLGLNGKVRIGNGTTFTFTGNGYIAVYDTSAGFIPGTGSSVRLIGNTIDDTVIEMYTGSRLTFPKGLNQTIITKGKINMYDGTKVSIYSPARLTQVQFTSPDGIRNTHQGLSLYGQKGVFINGCKFIGGNYGINNSISSPDTSVAKLYMQNSIIQNCGTGYRQYTGGFSLNGCTISGCGTGITTNFIVISSEIKNCELDNTTSNIVWIGGSLASVLSIDGSELLGSANSINVTGNTQLNMKCSAVHDVINTGLIAAYDACVNMSSQQGENGDVSFYDMTKIMRVISAGDLYLAEGYNQFLPSASGGNNILSGTQNVHAVADSFNASNNNWNNSGTEPIWDYDYKVVYVNNGSEYLYYKDPDPMNNATDCEYLEPCTSCPGISNPLLRCVDCETINTTNISGDPLNEALDGILEGLHNATNITGKEANITKLVEMLTYTMTSVNDEERYLLKYAYRTLKDEYARLLSDTLYNNDVENGFSSLGEYAEDLASVISFQQGVDIGDQLFPDSSVLKLDEALLYRITGNTQMAYDLVSDLLYEVDATKIPYIEYWLCILENEIYLSNATITQEEFDDNTQQCILILEEAFSGSEEMISYNSPKQNIKGKSIPDNTDERKVGMEVGNSDELQIYPNPSTGLFQLAMPDKIKTVKITVVDMYGKLVLEKEYTATTQIELNLNEMNNGIYSCTIITDQMKYERRIVKIK